MSKIEGQIDRVDSSLAMIERLEEMPQRTRLALCSCVATIMYVCREQQKEIEKLKVESYDTPFSCEGCPVSRIEDQEEK